MSVSHPVRVHTAMTSHADTAEALADIARQLDDANVDPDCLFVFYSPGYDDAAVHRFLSARYPGVPLTGGSSGAGVMSQSGRGGDVSLGVLAISDPDGAYGAAAIELGDDAAADAQAALHQALHGADAVGELPELVWIFQHPGKEEAVVEGLRRVVGDRCPILGGSAARSDEIPAWRQLGPDGPRSGALVVAVLFPSGGVAVSYQGGFEPTGTSGVVTALGFDDPDAPGPDTVGGTPAADPSSGISRHVLTIDGEPAAAVYDRWTGGAIDDDVVARGGSVAATSAWYPLGVSGGTAGGLEYYRLIHVDSISPERGLRTFAAVRAGEELHAMRGSRHTLITRAGRVAGSAIAAALGSGAVPAGALMIYCVGCRIAVGDDIGEVVTAAQDGFGAVPFLGCFTAGEQGPSVGENVHANLMISAVVFGQ